MWILRRITLIGAAVLVVGCAASSEPVRGDPAPALTGTPSWLPVGRDVADPNERLLGQARGSDIIPEPRWFLATPSLTTPQADWHVIPTNTHGISLSLYPSVIEKNLLVIGVQLSSQQRSLHRVMYTRRANVWPLLLAVWVDGKALQLPPRSTMAPRSETERGLLLERGESRPWLVRIREESLRALLPDNQPHELTLVATFCEMPHVNIADIAQASGNNPVIRSEPIRLRWTGSNWQFLK